MELLDLSCTPGTVKFKSKFVQSISELDMNSKSTELSFESYIHVLYQLSLLSLVAQSGEV